MGRAGRAAGPRILDDGARNRAPVRQTGAPRRPDGRARARELRAEGASAKRIRHELWAELRYRGQSYEIEVPLTPGYIADFHAAHQRAFGHSAPEAPVEVVSLRIRASARELDVVPNGMRVRARVLSRSGARP